MELLFLALLMILMIAALAAGYPVAFALPGSSIITLVLAALSGYLLTDNSGAFFNQGTATMWLSSGVANLRGIYWEPERDTLIAIPLFIFMGIMLQKSKIAEDLLITMAQLFGSIPGGLGISVVFVGGLLAATTGIVGATVVAMGLISLPAMLRNNYAQSLATGTIAASGTLGQIIPPSIVLIILADQLAAAADHANSLRKILYKQNTDELTMPSAFDVISTSAGEMFLGAFIPGLILVGLYMIYIFITAWLRPKLAPPILYDGQFDVQFALKVLLVLLPPLLLIFLVLGSIIMGVATVNQAGAVGAAGAVIMSSYRLFEGRARAYYPAILSLSSLLLLVIITVFFDTNIRNIKTTADIIGVSLALIAVFCLIIGLGWSGWRIYKINNTLHNVMIETAKATSLVFIILLGAAILTAAFRAFGGEHLVREFLEGLPGGFWTKFIIVMGVMFVLGFFLDFIEIAVVIVPIVAPILLADPTANITAVWLGVMIGLNLQTSFLTPPFGFALFYLRGVAPALVKTINIYKGVAPFIALQLFGLAIVSYIPALVNYLPNRIVLLSENAPPPRNPSLKYCVENYVSEQIFNNQTQILTATYQARTLDLSTLPQKQAATITDSFDKVNEAFMHLDRVTLIDKEIDEFLVSYTPLHIQTRRLQRDVHYYETLIAELEQRLQQSPTSNLRRKIINLQAQKEQREREIPSTWAQANQHYNIMVKRRDAAYRNYTNTARAAYEPIQHLTMIFASNDALFAMRDRLYNLKDQINTVSPADMLRPLRELSQELRAVAGGDTIGSLLSKTRRALKGHNIDKIKAQNQLAKAIREYEKQQIWRRNAARLLSNDFNSYEKTLRSTLGLRSQLKFTRKQALFMAACKSKHHDLSLNF